MVVFRGANETIKDCDAEVTGIADYEGEGYLKNMSQSVQGKYLSTDGRIRKRITIIEISPNGKNLMAESRRFTKMYS